MLTPKNPPKGTHTTHPDAQARMSMLTRMMDRHAVQQQPRMRSPRPAMSSHRVA